MSQARSRWFLSVLAWPARFLAWFPETWLGIDRQASAERASASQQDGLPPRYDSRPAQILVVAALVLIFEWYYGDRPFFLDLLGDKVAAHRVLSRYQDLLAFCWWSGSKIVGFLMIPVLHVWVMGGRLRDFGMPGWGKSGGAHGVGRVPWWLIYICLYLAVLPLIVAASFTSTFQHTYPFYRQANRSGLDFLAWELQYGATFLTVEFFFRGYLLFGLRRALGSHAIFVMMVPYCMIHALKPAAESVGAIIAGVVLGTLALSTGSIWCGVLIHVSVAWTMDILASLQGHGLPRWGHFLP